MNKGILCIFNKGYPNKYEIPSCCLTVRLLVTSTSTWTTELLWFTAARISNQQGSVVVDKDFLDLTLGSLINV